MLYVGVDAHKSASRLTAVDEVGEILDRRRVASTRTAFTGALEGYGEEPIKAVLEAGYSWGLIYDWLGEMTDEVVLAHPTKVRAVAEAKIKNDKLDSQILAHLLRTDLIPEACAPSRRSGRSNGSCGSGCFSSSCRQESRTASGRCSPS